MHPVLCIRQTDCMKILLLFVLGAVMAGAQAHVPALRVSMVSLGVKDMERSMKFYVETLGLALKGKPGEVTLLNAGGVTIALNRPLGRVSSVTSAVEVVFPAESVRLLHRMLTERGCRFVNEPREVSPGLWAATFLDPDGHRLTILGAE